MEQRATFVHAQSDTHGYTLLLEPGAAGEGSLCPQKPSSHYTPWSIHPHCWCFSSEECSRQGCNWKEIHCMWNWWIASCFNQHQKAYGFFSVFKVKILLLYHLLLYFHPCQISFLMSNQPSPPWNTRLGKTSGLVFSLWNREVNSVLGQLGHSCQFLFIISSTQLDVWNSQTLGETHVCLNFKSRLLAGNEYPATVAQLCLLKSKSNPSGHWKAEEKSNCSSVHSLVSAR